MAGDTELTVVGNIVDDPELRFTPAGHAVANFRVASTPRKFNKDTNEWEDQEPVYLGCSVWRQAAENVAESLQKGARVMVKGYLRCRSYENREGEKRYSWELDVQEVGASLMFATAKVTKTTRQGGGGQSAAPVTSGNDPWAQQGSQQQQGGQPQGQQGGGRAPDPWATPPPGDEPPF